MVAYEPERLRCCTQHLPQTSLWSQTLRYGEDFGVWQTHLTLMWKLADLGVWERSGGQPWAREAMKGKTCRCSTVQVGGEGPAALCLWVKSATPQDDLSAQCVCVCVCVCVINNLKCSEHGVGSSPSLLPPSLCHSVRRKCVM